MRQRVLMRPRGRDESRGVFAVRCAPDDCPRSACTRTVVDGVDARSIPENMLAQSCARRATARIDAPIAWRFEGWRSSKRAG
jgi:hypothetical protein